MKFTSFFDIFNLFYSCHLNYITGGIVVILIIYLHNFILIWWGSFIWRNIVWCKVTMGKGPGPSRETTGFRKLSRSLWKGGHAIHSGRMRLYFHNGLVKTSVSYLPLSWRQIKISERGWHWYFISKQAKPAKICYDWLQLIILFQEALSLSRISRVSWLPVFSIFRVY